MVAIFLFRKAQKYKLYTIKLLIFLSTFFRLGQTCNHVATILFRIDDAWKSGEVTSNVKSCTSVSCRWNVPAVRSEKLQVEIADLTMSKPKALRSVPSRGLNCAKKQLFGQIQRHKGMSESDFLVELAKISPDSVTLGERKPERNSVYQEYDKNRQLSIETPPSILNLSRECKSVGELQERMDDIFKDKGHSKVIEKATVQGSSLWEIQRHGRITASKFHRVHTRMNSLAKDSTISMNSVVCEVMGYTKVPSYIPALKY